jgi:hypothetical protein
VTNVSNVKGSRMVSGSASIRKGTEGRKGRY